MERVVGNEVGNYWRRLHESKGINFVFGVGIGSIEGN